MTDDIYRAGHRQRAKNKRRQRLIWTCAVLCLLLVIAGIAILVKQYLKPNTTISQGRPVTSHVSYENKTKHYQEPDFELDLPSDWQPIPRPPGPYQSYTWQTSDRGSKGQQIEIFEDTIPVNFTVNRALIVESQTDHLSLKGSASDNCSAYTKDLPTTQSQGGAHAKWQGVDFLCDQSNQERDIIGTSSADGVNMVVLRSPGTGVSHKFSFTYTDHSINPDYSVFYNTLTSFKMQ